MLLELMALTTGLLGLWFGSDLLIRSGKNVARHFGISYFFFGLAFVSIGTSIPEIAVSVAGALERLIGIETSGLVIGNKVGSALSQIAFIMGFLALFAKLKITKKRLYRQGILLLASIVLFFILAYDGMISRWDAIIFLLAYALYYILLFKTEKIKTSGKPPEIAVSKDIIYIIAGLGFILISSNVVVKNGIALAEIWGVAQSLVGLLLISLGTGLPELAIAVMAIRQRAASISLGDLIGSNICDLLLATGLGAVISGFIVGNLILVFDLPILFLFALIFLYFLLRKKLGRREGIVLITLYVLYVIVRIFFLN